MQEQTHREEKHQAQTYEVHALRLGSFSSTLGSITADLTENDNVEFPIFGAAVFGAGKRILVDTGLANPSRWSGVCPHHLAANHRIAAALAELGWKASDVDIVINSHLHYDHCENNRAFPQAQFFVSAKEWLAAHSPETQGEWGYAYGTDWLLGPELTIDNYTFVDLDDYEVLPGLRTISTPGHSIGHRSALVRTSEGVLCVAGDAACVMDNFTSGRAAPGLSPTQMEQSMDRIARSADRVLMAHDFALSDFQSTDFPTVTPRDQVRADRA